MTAPESPVVQSERGTIGDLVGRHPMIVFVTLACLLSWWLVPLMGAPLGVGPTLAALVVLSVTKGWPGIRSLLLQIVRWRVSWKWYLAAIGLPAFAAVAAAAITVGLGAPRPSADQIALWTDILPFFLFALFVPLLGPWEEPGFRGFALSRFMITRSPLVAGLAVGVIHVFWHLPLFFTGDIPTADVAYILMAAVVFAWLVLGSGGSVLMAMLMHATSNAVSGEYISPMFTGQDAETLGWVRAGIWALFAIAVIAFSGESFRTRSAIESRGESRSRPMISDGRAHIGRMTRTGGILVVCFALVTACGATGSGNLASEIRTPGEFTGVDVSDGISLRLVVSPDSESAVEVNYDDNIIGMIHTEVEDGVLMVSSEGSFDLRVGHGRYVEITVSDLEQLTASGGAKITGGGSTSSLAADIGGGAVVDLAELETADLNLGASGGARVTVNVSDSIQGSASGGAKVTILGNPASQEMDVSGGAEVTNG